MMGFAITPITGKSGRFQFSGGIISFEDCNVEHAVDRIEVTGTEDQLADGRTPQNLAFGTEKLSGTLTAAVDSTQLSSGILGLKGGSTISNLKIFMDKNVAPRYYGASFCMVLSVRAMGRLKDKWMFSIQFESTGGFGCTITHPS